MPKKLEWNAYIANFNRKTIESYNVFNHFRFYEDCKKNAKKNAKDYEAFCNQLKRDLQYYFWSRCEWEIIISDWPTSGRCDEKVDVYDQISLNLEHFCRYVWEHAVDLRRREK